MPPPPVDADLARHCLDEAHLGKVKFMCPTVTQSQFAKAPHPSCDGLSPNEVMYEWLLSALRDRDGRKKKSRKYRELTGQIQALTHTVALMTNPYNPNPDKILTDAVQEAFE